MPASTDPADGPTDATETGNPDAGDTGTAASGAGKADGGNGGNVGGDTARKRGRLVPALAVLLVLLLAGAAFLWSTRPKASAVSTGDYAQALQAARSGVVDLTSFDYLTLDDDIEQVRRVATGDLKDESVKQLDGRRKQITDAQAVVNTEVVGAGVTRADDSSATVLLVIQSTQASTATPKPQIVRYRIEVSLEKKGQRWLLSGIKGTGNPSDK
jgi:Mce-associated membrane protein